MFGNASVFGLEGNNEPFLIPWQSSGVAFISLTETKDTHYVGISIATEETQNPYDIVLKTWDGSEVIHNAPNGIEVLLPDGNTQRYIPGESEEKTVWLDFSTGDMEVTPSTGKLLTKVSIPTPANLLPTNIAKDVEIAGIVGTHDGGGNGGDIVALVNRTITTFESGDITEISPYVFYNCTALTSVNAPNLTKVGEYAFYQCSGLKTIDVSKVHSVGSYAFYGVKSLTLDFGTSLDTKIGINAFGSAISTNIIIRNTTMIPDASSDLNYIISTATSKLFVPRSMVSTWKASNYMKRYHSDHVYAIEDYPDICG